jgi:hypothetical protein
MTAPLDPAVGPATMSPPSDPTPPADPPPADPPKDTPTEKVDDLPQWARDAITKANNDAAKYRTQLREAEPIVKAHKETEERNKTELQRATEQAAQFQKDLAERDHRLNLMTVAHKYGVPEKDFDLLGSGTLEEMEARAVRQAPLWASAPVSPPPPPSDRPVESLRPGASPQPPVAEDTSYPESWRPAARGRS